MNRIRCPWCHGNAEYTRYHDEEWGVPLTDSKKLFSLLVLEGAQAGLSWITILKRRPGYLEAMDRLDPVRLAAYSVKDRERLKTDSRIIRNSRKIQSAVDNARAYLDMLDRGEDFSQWLWSWVDGAPIQNSFKSIEEVPASTPLSERISRELRKKGFSFVGPTIIYAYMQSAGLVNDHLTDCYRYAELVME